MLEHSREDDKPSHSHRDCSGRERVWLEKDRKAAASATRHPFCVICGTVRDLGWPKAKPLGYYLNGVAVLKEYLERSSPRQKLAQVQSHLITTRLAARPEFEDPYGTPGHAQLEAYVDIVRSVRKDLDDELILRLLPGVRRRARKEPADEVLSSKIMSLGAVSAGFANRTALKRKETISGGKGDRR